MYSVSLSASRPSGSSSAGSSTKFVGHLGFNSSRTMLASGMTFNISVAEPQCENRPSVSRILKAICCLMVSLFLSVGRGQRSGGRVASLGDPPRRGVDTTAAGGASWSGSDGDIAVRFENGTPDGCQLVACQLRQFPKDTLQWRLLLVRALRQTGAAGDNCCRPQPPVSLVGWQR